jgi:predicted glutamine amidotransferase
VSTEPLTTNETWRALVPGESLLLVDGEIVACHTSTGAQDRDRNLRPV